jgi:DHA1 family inner membrane transport protein
MTTSVSIDFRRSQIVAALAIGCVALMMLGLQPLLLGHLVEQQRVSLDGVGLVAMGEILALGVGVILAGKFYSLRRLHLVAVLSCLVLAALNLLTLAVRGDLACLAIRIAAGLAEASLFWITTAVMVRARQPDRLAGVFLTAQTLAQAAVAFILAKVSLQFLGWGEGFVALAVASLLLLLVVRYLPKQVGTHTDAVTPSVVSLRGFWGLLVPFAHLSAVGTLWAYLEPLGKAAGIATEDADVLVALVLIMQIVGGSVASIAVRRWRVAPAIVASAVVFAAIGLALHGLPYHSVFAFTALCGLFGFVWLFQMPFHYRLAFDIDPSGRVAMLVPAAQLLGSGFGPLAASFGVHGDDVQHIPLIAGGLAACVVLALFAVNYRVLFRHQRFGVLPDRERIK